ncbi:MAG: patatin-like phospholipase family protein [Desulfonatronovibrio sp.]
MDFSKLVASRRDFLGYVSVSAAGLVLAPLNTSARSDESSSSDRPSIGLALGSGGASGLAHIVMLEVFDELDIKPSIIAGSSIGSIIGALYASGLSGKEIRDIVLQFSGSDMEAFRTLIQGDSGLELMDLLKVDLDAGGLLDTQGFLNFLKDKIRVSTFEELPVPLVVAAADYWKQKQVVIDSGDIVQAVKASMAVPGLFAPVAWQDRLLVDGGTVNPLPYDLVADKCDVVVAIDVSGGITPKKRDKPNFSDSLFNSFDIMQQAIIHQKLKYQQPDIYIRPEIKDIRMLHFHRSPEIFEQAASAAGELRNKLDKLLG